MPHKYFRGEFGGVEKGVPNGPFWVTEIQFIVVAALNISTAKKNGSLRPAREELERLA